MAYSCTDFTDDVLDRLCIVLPVDELDDPAAQAQRAIGKIDALYDLLSECRTHLSEWQHTLDESEPGNESCIPELLDRIDDVLGPIADSRC